MSQPFDGVQTGELYLRAFTDMAQPWTAAALMPAERASQYRDWIRQHPNYHDGEFPAHMRGAIDWMREHPVETASIIDQLDAAVAVLNGEQELDPSLCPNVIEYRHLRGETRLPLLQSGEERPPHFGITLARAAIEAARSLRWGETIRPEGETYYGYHLWLDDDRPRAMVVQTLLDMYESFARTTGLYPAGSDAESLVSCAVTEVLSQTNPDGTLFTALRDPHDQWIYHYSGFASALRRHLYGPKANQAALELSPDSVGAFFEQLAQATADVPELRPVMEMARRDPEHVSAVYSRYVDLVRAMAGMDAQQVDEAQALRLARSRHEASSASDHSLQDLFRQLGGGGQQALGAEAARSIDDSSAYLAYAVRDFADRTSGGHRLFGDLNRPRPADGDPEADGVIWGHTQITNPEALLHFAVAHYMERYLSQVLVDYDIPYARDQKDYFLNAIGDYLWYDHARVQQFNDIFNAWAVPRASVSHPDNGLGWIKLA